MKAITVLLLGCLLNIFLTVLGSEQERFTGHGVRILSGSGTPADPYNKPRTASRGVGYAVSQRLKHEMKFGHLYEDDEGNNNGKFVKLHARKLEVDRNETDGNTTGVTGMGVNVTYNWNDPNRPNKGCEGSSEWDMACHYCTDETSCDSGNCNWLVPNNGYDQPSCQYDECYSGTCDVSRMCDMENDADCWWQIPCRDCTGPGQVCEGVAACTDPLRMCDSFSDEEQANMSAIHPCFNPVCESSRTSPGCLDLVYDFCCDPEFDDCNPSAEVVDVRESTPCSAAGCATFMQNDNDDGGNDFSDIECAFQNKSICANQCYDQAFQVYDSFKTGTCVGNSCLKSKVYRHLNERFRRRLSDHTGSGSNHTNHTGSDSNHTHYDSNHTHYDSNHTNHTEHDSNHTQYDSNHTQYDSNHTGHGSNHSGYDSNHTGHGSNHTGHGSNHTGHGSNHTGHGSNHTGHGSNHTGHGSNHTGHGSNHTGHGSNHTGHGSNHTGHGSNHTGHGSNHTGHGSNHTGHGSNHTGHGSNHTGHGSNHTGHGSNHTGHGSNHTGHDPYHNSTHNDTGIDHGDGGHNGTHNDSWIDHGDGGHNGTHNDSWINPGDGHYPHNGTHNESYTDNGDGGHYPHNGTHNESWPDHGDGGHYPYNGTHNESWPDHGDGGHYPHNDTHNKSWPDYGDGGHYPHNGTYNESWPDHGDGGHYPHNGTYNESWPDHGDGGHYPHNGTYNESWPDHGDGSHYPHNDTGGGGYYGNGTHGGGDSPDYDVGYCEHPWSYAGQCQEPDQFFQAIQYGVEGISSVLECVRPGLNSTKLECGLLMSCMSIFMELFTSTTGASNYMACFGTLVACWEYDPTMPISQAEFYQLRSLYCNYGACNPSDTSFTKPATCDRPVFDPNWDYLSPCNQSNPECGSGCCGTMDSLFFGEGELDFGHKDSSAVFSCGQLPTENGVRECLRGACSSCYANGGGPLGPPAASNGLEESESECIEAIFDHCQSTPQDPACQETCPFTKCDGRALDCPCDSSSCSAFYDADFEQRAKCSAVFNEVLSAYAGQGFYQPEEEWLRERLLYDNAIQPKTNNTFVIPQKVLDMAAFYGCNLLPDILNCSSLIIPFCNTRTGSRTLSCTQLSTCGDGAVSWGEWCDDGNDNSYDDGCQGCNGVTEGYVCEKPGVPCERCDLDPRRQNPNEQFCPFCLNTRTGNNTSPCEHKPCQSVSDYASAQVCDEYINSYCAKLDEASLFDPGCRDHVNLTRSFTVPALKGNCEYNIRKIDLKTERVKGIKIALIECEFYEPYANSESTPYVQYTSPISWLTESDFEGLNASIQASLEVQQKADIGAFVPVSSLTDHELSAFSDTSLHKDNQPFKWETDFQNIARLNVKQENGQKYFRDTNPESCSWAPGETMEVLPPSQDMGLAAITRLLQRFQWRAVHEHSWEYSEFANIDLSELDLENNPKENVLQFMRVISRNRMEWQGGSEIEVEEHDYYCEGHYDWHRRDEQCTTYEDLLKQGRVEINFANKLFQSTCDSDKCEHKIAPCVQSMLVESTPEVNATAFDIVMNKISEDILKLDTVQTTEEMFFQLNKVSLFIATDAISNVFRLFESFTVAGTRPRLLRDVRDYCPHTYDTYNYSTGEWKVNEEWKLDPCCNWELRDYLCCPLQDVPNGEVSYIASFDEGWINTKCSNPTETKRLLEDLLIQMEQARANAEFIEEEFEKDRQSFESPWEFEQGCRNDIFSDDTCTSDGDCYCSLSKCRVGWDGKGRCETAERDLYKCYAECFISTSSTLLLGYLKQEWGLPSTANDEEFTNAWGEYMTESGCAGPESWHSDIGYAGYHWECDTKCQANFTCDIYAASRQIFTKRYGEEGRSQWPIQLWELNYDEARCSEYNGTYECLYRDTSTGMCYHGQCVLEETVNYDVPCYESEKCLRECNIPCEDEAYCNATNGTWMGYDWGGGQCCPQPYFGYKDEWNNWQCKYLPKGSPSSWQVQDETCCLAAGGEWYQSQYSGEWGQFSCCLGKVRKTCEGGLCSTYCEENVDVWSLCNDCQKGCHQKEKQCRMCFPEQEKCCGQVYVSQNQDACLSYEGCNDRSIQDRNQCNSPDPWCGDWGWDASSPAQCIIIPDGSATCESLNGTMGNTDWGYQCNKPSANTVSECFGECPVRSWSERYPSFEEPAHGRFGWEQCSAGCYFNASKADEIGQRSWGHRQQTICRMQVPGQGWTVELQKIGDYCKMDMWMVHHNYFSCEALNGTMVESNAYYKYPKYLSKDQCDAGYCEGSINNGKHDPITGEYLEPQPWSTEQCTRLSESSCTRWCPHCEANNHEANQAGGMCFNSTNLAELSSFDEAQCANSTGATWYTCPEIPVAELKRYNEYHKLESYCSAPANIPAEVQAVLQCSGRHERCNTQESCEAMGECQGTRFGHIEFITYVCTESGWQHGDQHWGEKLVSTYDTVTNSTVTYTEWEECDWTYRQTIDGICIKERPSYGCDNYKYHQLGCKTDGFHNQSACEAANHTWFDRPYDKTSCEQIKGCRQDWHVSKLSAEECSKCGGTQESMMRWSGGSYRTAFSRGLTYYNNRTFTPINEWIKTQATWKIQEQLLVPAMKMIASYRKNQLLVKYNMYKDVLSQIAVTCGSNSYDAEPLETITQTDAISAQVNAFLGSCEPQQEMGPGAFIQVSACDTNGRRMLSTDNSTLQLIFTHISIAGNQKFEPCQGDNSSLVDTLVVKNDAGVIIGQVTGDGFGLNASQSFGGVSYCMNSRSDIKLYDQFDTYAVAKREGSTFVGLYLNDSLYSTKTASSLCLTFTEEGEYFPMIGVAESIATSSSTCTSACVNGDCVVDHTGAYQCVCHCGFSGSTCDVGCKNYCSSQGTCDSGSNTCTCATDSANQPMFINDDCSVLNCPLNPTDNTTCSLKGGCSLNNVSTAVVCTCSEGYSGDACEIFESGIEVNNTAQGDSGYGTVDSSGVTEVDYGGFTITYGTNAPTTPTAGDEGEEETGVPTWQPTSEPTSTPTFAPEPIATISIPLVADVVNDTTTSTETLLENLEQGVLDSLVSGDSSTQEDIEVEVTVVVEESSSLTLATEPSQEEKDVYEAGLQLARCGMLPVSVCEVTLVNSTRRRLTAGYVLAFKVVEQLDDDAVEQTAALNETSKPVKLEDASFQTKLVAALATAAAESSTSLPTTNITVAAVTKSVTAKVAIVLKDTSSTAVTDIQQNSQNSTHLMAKLGEATGIENVVQGSIEVDLCEGRTCSGHGTCSEGTCTCTGGYTGTQCSVPPPTTSPTLSPVTPEPSTSTPTVTANTDAPTSLPTLVINKSNKINLDVISTIVCILVLVVA